MKRKLLLCILAAIVLAFFAAVIVGADIRRAHHDHMPYDMFVERVYEGTVASKGHEIEGMMYFPRLTDIDILEVEIGPKEFVEHSGFELKVGEAVTVIGMAIERKGPTNVLAREVRKMGAVLVVRDERG